MRRIERSAEQAGTNHSDIRLGRSRKPRESWGTDTVPFTAFMRRSSAAWSGFLSAPHHPLYRSEEHTSELPSLMRISYAVFCLKKKNTSTHKNQLLVNIIINSLQKY